MFAGLLILASVIAAEPIDPGHWATPMDYPTEELRQNRGGTVAFRVTVAEDGKPIRCEVTATSGHDVLDKTTCALVIHRGRFEPARDATGKPSFAIHNNRVVWWTPNMGRRQHGPDKSGAESTAEIRVRRLAPKFGSQPTIQVAFEVDALGKLSNCSPLQSWAITVVGGKAKTLDRRAVDLLGKPACESLPADLKLNPAKDREGKPVASVQTIRVMFLEEEGKD